LFVNKNLADRHFARRKPLQVDIHTKKDGVVRSAILFLDQQGTGTCRTNGKGAFANTGLFDSLYFTRFCMNTYLVLLSCIESKNANDPF